MIKFRCSGCSKKIGVPVEYASKQVRCPHCRNAVVVPKPETESASEAELIPETQAENLIELEAEPETESIWTDEMLSPSVSIPSPETPESQLSVTSDMEESPQSEQPHKAVNSLAGSIVYPIKGTGKYMLIALTVTLIGLNLISKLPVLRIIPIIIGFILPWYFFAYLTKIISSSAAGDDELPDWPDMTALWDNVVSPTLSVLWTIAVSFAPVIVYYFAFSPRTPDSDRLLWGLIIFSCLYFPMALLAVIIHDSWIALNPIRVIPAIFKVFGYYIIACIILVLVIGSFYYLTKINLPFPFLNVVLSIYLLMVAMRIVGLIYHKKEQQIGWF
jgi:DNA-directed RNA polymerase subunit RPC12/RpoP